MAHIVAYIGLLLLALGTSRAQTPVDMGNGFKPWGSYDGSNLDSVSLEDGNLLLHAPLIPTYPQRGSLAPQLSLYVSSHSWQKRCLAGTPPSANCYWSYGGTTVDFQFVGGMSVQRTIQVTNDPQFGTSYADAGGYTLTTWDGATHQLYGGSTGMETLDTSGYSVTLSNPDQYGINQTVVITDRKGRQNVETFGGARCPKPNVLAPGAGGAHPMMYDTWQISPSQCSEHSIQQEQVDTNGNEISLAPPLVSSTPPADTMGRAAWPLQGATVSDSSNCILGGLTFSLSLLYNYSTPYGGSGQIKICQATFSPQTNFGLSNVTEAQNTSLTSPIYLTTNVMLADGTQWVFSYDSYGNLTSISLPTGGTITYTWETIPGISTLCQVNYVTFPTPVERAVQTRTLTDNNGHSSTWTYHWGAVQSDSSVTNWVTDPLGNDTVHIFHTLPNTQCYGSGYGPGLHETTTQYWQGTRGSGTLLKQVDTSYNRGTILAGSNGFLFEANMAPTDIQTTVYPSDKVSLVHKDYDTAFGSSGPMLASVVAEKEYDWGQGSPGALLRETDTTYQWQVNGSYLTASMADLPASVVVKDGSGCALAETDYTYDESAYLTASNISTQHVAAPNPVRGNLTTVTKWVAPTSSCNPKGGTAIVSHANWYDTGEVYQQIDPLGRATTHSYHPAYAGAYSTETCSPTTNGGTTTHCVSGTYDFSTGLLTSFTNENATQQAAGNTPGDSAHTTTYAYDFLERITSATAPPDPNNGNAQAQTLLTYSAPGVLPETVQRQKSIAPGAMDSITTTYDGLGRPYKTQHPLPNGTAEVDTVYDALGRVATVTNPYFSTSDPTYGITQTAYDALGRATQVTEQDGSVKSVAYDVTPVPWDPGDCTVTVEEAGNQRKTCSDALGRLVQVDEPNPGAAASYASGSVAISGSEQQAQSQPATSGSGAITIGGYEQSGRFCPLNHCVTIYDTGNVNIAVGSYPAKSFTYGKLDSAATVAWNLSCLFHNDSSSPVDASCPASAGSSTTVNLVARATGASTNYSFTTSANTTDNTGTFGGPSFTPSPVSGALTGGQNASTVADTGTVTATLGGSNYTVSYAANDTSSTIAANLAAAISAGSLASASASGSTVNITSKTAGSGHDYSIAVGSTWNSSQFTNPSFTISSSGSDLTGGYNPGDPSNSPFITQYAYDGLGDLLQVNQKGDGSQSARVRSFTYDTLGRLLTATNPESGTISYAYDANSNVATRIAPAPNQTGSATVTTSYAYDERNRLTQKTYSDGTTPRANFYYDLPAPWGWQLSNYIGELVLDATFDASSGTQLTGNLYNHDIMGRVSLHEQGCTASNCSTPSDSVAYTFDLNGDITSEQIGQSGVFSVAYAYTYDSAARLTSMTSNLIDAQHPATLATVDPSLGYYPAGEIRKMTVGNGLTETSAFNNRLQPCRMNVNSSSGVLGQCGDSASPGTVLDFTYGFNAGVADDGNVVSFAQFVPVALSSSMFSESGLSNYIAANIADGNTSSNGWHTDSATPGAWLQVDLGAGNQEAITEVKVYPAYAGYAGNYSIQYSDDGSAWGTASTGFVPGQAGWNVQSWSSVGAHRFWRLYLTNTPGPGPWLNELEFLAQGTRSYGYDSLNRLTAMSAPSDGCSGLSWSYDAWGNRLAQNLTRGSCHSFQAPVNAQNQLVGYQYDAAGNMVYDGTHNYVYDAENRIVSVDGGATTYQYDAQGHRVTKTTGGAWRNYLFAMDGNVVAETTAPGWQVGYAYFGGALLAQYRDSTTYFVEHDHLGSTRLLTKVDKTVYDSMDYLPYGEQIAGDTGSTHKFTGKERDSETNLDYFGARYYQGATGRFMSVDPRSEGAEALEPQSWNAYAYVGNNPLTMTDPDGRSRDYHLYGPDGGYQGDLSGPAFDRWCRQSGCKVDAGGTIRNKDGDILGKEREFDGDKSRELNNQVAFMNWFMVNQSLEIAGGAAEGYLVAGRGFLSGVWPQIARNKLKGKIGEATVNAVLRLKGYKIIGEHVTVRTAKGIRFADKIVEKDGRVFAVEVKTGGATRKSAQLAKDYSASAEGATIGNNGGALEGQTIKLHTTEVHPF